MLAAILANANRTKKSQKAFKLDDFMPKEPSDTEPESWETMLKQAKTITELFGGKRG